MTINSNSTAPDALGTEHALVTVVEFTDHLCPYCLRFDKTTFSLLKQKYIDTGQVVIGARPMNTFDSATNKALARQTEEKQTP